ncbi:CYTH and CHAD domain-containing protein [Blastococcus sp. TML/M2B]|uniref:CYTH and CHAD domain-containing protein n=1 Tax=unclassified Blastococcus TaxID=2619396 RepID=UPI00190A20F3|nr:MULTISPECIES: CYTH and CHAD domain-containing protein [unclassified Blastococcus]MBN1094437.1 CYTH and CHAD domain-containing protein [Blastococcus sp. TML/M2B]MBN1095396.1 CYTH and CHAD domain-containing protein [Blastococcus sp. TML/C7B]
MAAEQLEIETKFDVPLTYVVPELAGVEGVASADAPVEHRLEARYFDTADLRLARARITLRRRTGGTDAGWHVKLPATEGARRELHQPLGRATRRPPKAVTAPLAGVLRSAVPGPVAQLRTRRVVTVLRDADGRPLAEVADDTVSATRLSGPDGTAEVRSWREVEVELIEGDRALLGRVGERLVAAGAATTDRASKLARALGQHDEPEPPADERPAKRKKKGKAARPAGPSAGEVALTALADEVRALQLADVGLRTGADDGLRRMRIACRRLRGLLAAFRPLVDRTATDPLREELRWLAARLSEARDEQVAFAGLRASVAELPPELVLGPVAARLQASEIAAAERGRARAADLVAERRHLELLDALDALLAAPPLTARASGPAVEVLPAVLRRETRRVRSAAAHATTLTDAERTEELHAVRRRARRARFTAQALAPVLGDPARDVARTAKRTQRLLGALQDLVVVASHARQLAVSAHAAGEPGFTYGLLLGRAEERARDAERVFAERWPALAERLGG